MEIESATQRVRSNQKLESNRITHVKAKDTIFIRLNIPESQQKPSTQGQHQTRRDQGS